MELDLDTEVATFGRLARLRSCRFLQQATDAPIPIADAPDWSSNQNQSSLSRPIGTNVCVTGIEAASAIAIFAACGIQSTPSKFPNRDPEWAFKFERINSPQQLP